MRKSERDMLDNSLARKLLRQRADISPSKLGTPTTPGVGDDTNRDRDAFSNPMSDVGDLIVGLESGAPDRRGIGTEGQVLTVVNDGTDLVPDWADATGGTPYTDEQVRDVMGTTLVAGSNITITVDDPGDQITIAATGGGGGSALEVSQDGVSVDAAVVELDVQSPLTTSEPVDHHIEIGVDVGTSAGQVAAGDHTHSGVYSPVSHTHPSTEITDFVEAAQDAVGGAIADSTSIDFTYDDATNSITGAVKYAGTGSADTAARSDHDHDSRYYTETEVDTLLTGKADDADLAGLITGIDVQSNFTPAATDVQAITFSTAFEVTETSPGLAYVGLPGTAIQFDQDTEDGPQLRPGFLAADTTTECSPTDGQAIAHYLGQANRDIQGILLRTQIPTTPFIAGTGTSWAEVAIATSPTWSLNGNANLTVIDTANVASSFNSTGSKTVNFDTAVSPIPAGTHIWVIWSQKIGSGGQLFKLRGGLAESPTSGLNQFKISTRPSTMVGSTAFSLFGSAGNQAIWYFQFQQLSSEGIGGGGSDLVFTVKDDGTTVDDAVNVIDFGTGFTVSESPAHEINVSLDSDLAGYGEDDSTVEWLHNHKFGRFDKVPNATTIQGYGAIGGGLAAGSSSNDDDTDGAFLRYTTSASTGAAGGRSSTTDGWRPEWGLTFTARGKTGNDLTTQRIEVGLKEVAGFNNDAPTVDAAWFRYSTATGDTNWQAVTCNSTGCTVTDTGISVVADTAYWFRCHFGTAKAKFYIDDVLVATNEAANGHKLPTGGGTLMTWVHRLVTTASFSRYWRFGSISISSKK